MGGVDWYCGVDCSFSLSWLDLSIIIAEIIACLVLAFDLWSHAVQYYC